MVFINWHENYLRQKKYKVETVQKLKFLNKFCVKP